MKKEDVWLIHGIKPSGHRFVWVQLFASLLNSNYLISPLVKIDIILKLLKVNKLFIITIDDNYLFYSLIGILRSFLKKRTVALLCAPQTFFYGKKHLKSLIKRILFKHNMQYNYFDIFSIVPHKYNFKYKEISNDWIYDPHLWNLWVSGIPKLNSTKVSEYILEVKKNKKIIIYIGKSSFHKGFKDFIDFVLENKNEYIGIVGGLLTSEYLFIKNNENFIIIERFINDDELLSLYSIADLVWCKYIKEYDQSSGIFGYAIQTNCKPIYRNGSFISKLYQEISNIRIDNFTSNAKEIAMRKINNEDK